MNFFCPQSWTRFTPFHQVYLHGPFQIVMRFLILAVCANFSRGQNVDDAIRDLYMKIDNLEQENMDIHRELDFLENEVTGRVK